MRPAIEPRGFSTTVLINAPRSYLHPCSLGVETIHDLADLTQGDLIKLGLGDAWPRFSEALAKIRNPRATSTFHQRRRAATEAILAAGASFGNVSSSTVGGEHGGPRLSLYFQAGGATMYADRLSALGVRVAADLSLLRRADLSEMGMLVLHARRFLAAARLAPRYNDEPALAAARAVLRTHPAHESWSVPGDVRPASSLCDVLLRHMRLGEYCTPLARRVHTMRNAARHGVVSAATAMGAAGAQAPVEPHPLPMSALCVLSTVDLEAVGMRLLQRRRMRAAARELCTPATAHVASQSGGESGGAAGDGHAMLDGCRHVFIDVGANVRA
jgi:hypothetical protein